MKVLRLGHSRVPVHAPGNRQAILGILLVKELVLIDPGDKVPVFSHPLRVTSATVILTLCGLWFKVGEILAEYGQEHVSKRQCTAV